MKSVKSLSLLFLTVTLAFVYFYYNFRYQRVESSSYLLNTFGNGAEGNYLSVEDIWKLSASLKNQTPSQADVLSARITDTLLDEKNLRKDYIVERIDVAISGFANIIRSFISAIYVALLTNRKLRIYYPVFFEIMDSPFTPLMINSTNWIQPSFTVIDNNYIKKNTMEYRSCSMFLSPGNYSFSNGHDARCPSFDFSKLNDLGFDCPKGVVKQCIKKKIAEMLIRPNREIWDVIHYYLRFFQGKNVIGLQLRVGGKSANTRESTRFLSQAACSRFPVVAREFIARKKWDPKQVLIFVASDSDAAIDFVRQSLNATYEVLSTHHYKRGHSGAVIGGKKDVLLHNKLTLVDLILMSKCNYLIRTEGSSYGRLASFLGGIQSYEIARDRSICVVSYISI